MFIEIVPNRATVTLPQCCRGRTLNCTVRDGPRSNRTAIVVASVGLFGCEGELRERSAGDIAVRLMMSSRKAPLNLGSFPTILAGAAERVEKRMLTTHDFSPQGFPGTPHDADVTHVLPDSRLPARRPTGTKDRTLSESPGRQWNHARPFDRSTGESSRLVESQCRNLAAQPRPGMDR